MRYDSPVLKTLDEMGIVRIVLSKPEAKMLLEMFATIEDLAGLGGDMAELYKKLREQIPE